MNLLRIAARVAARPKDGESLGVLTLNGPFGQSKPDEEADVTVPVGLDGAIVPILINLIGYKEGEPGIPEEEEAIRQGPNELNVGYTVESSTHFDADPSVGYGGDYELVIEITHLFGQELSGEDKVQANRLLNDAVREAVTERHAEERGEPDYDDGGY